MVEGALERVLNFFVAIWVCQGNKIFDIPQRFLLPDAPDCYLGLAEKSRVWEEGGEINFQTRAFQNRYF